MGSTAFQTLPYPFWTSNWQRETGILVRGLVLSLLSI
jgi:hypothetical protein